MAYRGRALGTLMLALAVLAGAAAVADAASLTLTWRAPTTNIDGTPLTDLAGYNVYVSPSTPACGGPLILTVPSPVPIPSEGETLTYRVNGLTAGMAYAIAVSAAALAGVQSDCSMEAVGIAHADFTVSPSQVDFGSTVVGASVDRTFSVRNTGTSPLSIAVRASSPFVVVSGDSSTVGPGATQDVVVRFSPGLDATFSGLMSVTVDGDTISASVVGTATLANQLPPPDTPSLTFLYSGKPSDAVGTSSVGLEPDQVFDAMLTATLRATGGRTITRLRLQSSAPGEWDTDAATAAWVLGAAMTLEGNLLNNSQTMAVDFYLSDGGTLDLFAADLGDSEFVPGTTLTLTATFDDGTSARAITVASPPPPLVSVTYDGKLRDRVGPGSIGLDGALDATLTVTLSATDGRIVTGVQLQSSAPADWDTDAATSAWALGVATTLDGPLLNNRATMAVNFAVADGGSFRLFAADPTATAFVPDTVLTVTVRFSDGTSASGFTLASLPTPSLALTYNGKLADRVGQGRFALGLDGAPDGTLTMTVAGSAGRSITRLRLQSSAPGTWDTDITAGAWVLGVAYTLGGELLNKPTTMAVDFIVPDGGTFKIFAADWANREFVFGTTLTLIAEFSDTTTVEADTVVLTASPSLELAYNGKLTDRVGQGRLALGMDGAPDGTLTVTVAGSAGRSITRLQLQSSAPGTWDTDITTGAWVLGVAMPPDSATLLNDPTTMAVDFTVPDGGTFRVFAADWANIEFVPGTTLTLTALFSDGTTVAATTTVTTPAPSLALTYNGKLQDRVGQGRLALGMDGAPDGTLTVTVAGSAGRSITRLQLQSSAPGTWDTDITTGAWVLGVAMPPNSATLLNDATTMAVNFFVVDGDTFRVFAADWANIEFVPGTTLTLTAKFLDGSSVTGAVTVP